MAHWCFQLLCILKTRMSWKSLCLLFFISTKTFRFYWIEKTQSDWRIFKTGDVATVNVSLLVVGVCHGNGQCCSLLLRVTAPLRSYSLNVVTQHFSHSLPPLLPPSSPSTQTIIAIFQSGDFHISSHLALRTWSVFLILTKINLLFSRWILGACKCCDSHIL